MEKKFHCESKQEFLDANFINLLKESLSSNNGAESTYAKTKGLYKALEEIWDNINNKTSGVL